MISPHTELLIETVQKLVRRRAKANLIKILSKTHPADIGHALNSLLRSEQRYLIGIMPDDQMKADVLSESDWNNTVELLKSMPSQEIAPILSKMSTDDSAGIMSAFPEEKQNELFSLMEAKDSLDVERLLQYADETAGRIMTPEFLAFNEDTTCEEVLEHIRNAEEKEMVFYLYVTDNHNHLQGVLSLRQIVTAKPSMQLKHIMNPEVISVRHYEDQEEVARLVARYNILAIPVVDEQNKMLGIVTIDDVVDIIREEATEDILMLAGTSDEEIESKSVFRSAKTRILWLTASFAGGLIAAQIINQFQSSLNKHIVLAAFMPIILGMGGNVGTQTLTITVRGLATGKIEVKSLWRLFFKETGVGLILGTCYGIALAIISSFQFGFSLLAFVVGVGIFSSMMAAVSIGVLMPMLFERLKIDPAVASGPFVTTFIDVVALSFYFFVASIFI